MRTKKGIEIIEHMVAGPARSARCRSALAAALDYRLSEGYRQYVEELSRAGVVVMPPVEWRFVHEEKAP